MKHEAAEAQVLSTDRIVITDFDRRRLLGLLELLRTREGVNEDTLDALEIELERAEVVRPEEVPPDVVTMNSQVELEDLDTHENLCITVVFPGSADAGQRRISVLAPIGLALLGCREGDEVAWPTPSRTRRLRVGRIVYQPEAAGRFDF
jgi:regulator of nucleoside diphosphate kinase